MYKKIKYIFVFILIFSLWSIHSGITIYPSIRFPIFPHKKQAELHFQKVTVYNRTGQALNLLDIIKPYDKYYYIVSLEHLSYSDNKSSVLTFLNFLDNDSLYYSTDIISKKELLK